jgi:hypothetical protein
MENINQSMPSELAQVPSLALPDAESARRFVGRWLRTEIGDALYPAEVNFVEESFTWHISIWFSTASQPMTALIADVYLNAATGVFIGRPSKEELTQRLHQIVNR